MIGAQAKLVAHAPAALLIRRSVDYGGNNTSIYEFTATPHEKVPSGKSYLSVLVAQLNQSARSRKQNCYSLRTLRHPREKIRLRGVRSRRQCDNLLAAILAVFLLTHGLG